MAEKIPHSAKEIGRRNEKNPLRPTRNFSPGLRGVHTPGILYEYQSKGLTKIAFRK